MCSGHNIDPLTPNGQFCDHGTSVSHRDLCPRLSPAPPGRSLEAAALNSRSALIVPIVTEIVPATEFYPSGGVHQHYFMRKNPVRYRFYRLETVRRGTNALTQHVGSCPDTCGGKAMKHGHHRARMFMTSLFVLVTGGSRHDRFCAAHDEKMGFCIIYQAE